jgi:hypothetical protein
VLISIRSSPELVNDFVLALFSEDIEERWPVSIRDILTATLLRYYEEFIHIIEQYPAELYEDNSRHALVHTVNRALHLANVSCDTFNHWCKEIRHGFGINNFMALPMISCPQTQFEKQTSTPGLCSTATTVFVAPTIVCLHRR